MSRRESLLVKRVIVTGQMTKSRLSSLDDRQNTMYVHQNLKEDLRIFTEKLFTQKSVTVG